MTQQAILAVPCNRPVQAGNVSLSIGNSTARLPSFRHGSALFDIDPKFKINIINGLANPSTNRTISKRDCTTGNCTFTAVNGITHSYAGICSKRVNTTSGITFSANATNMTDTPTVLFWNATGGQPSIPVLSLIVFETGQTALTFPANVLSEFEGVLPSTLLNVSVIAHL
jgi:hypothetical protein